MIPQPIVSRSVCAGHQRGRRRWTSAPPSGACATTGTPRRARSCRSPARSSTRAVASISSTGSIVSCITPMRNGGVTTAILSRSGHRPALPARGSRAVPLALDRPHRRGTASCTRTIRSAGSILGRGSTRTWPRSGPERIFVAELDGRLVGLAGMIVRGRKVELEPLSVRAGCRGRRDRPPAGGGSRRCGPEGGRGADRRPPHRPERRRHPDLPLARLRRRHAGRAHLRPRRRRPVA